MEMSNISGKFSSSSSLTALNDKGRKKSIAGDDKGRRKSSAAESDLATMSHSPRSPRGSKPGAVSFLKPRAVVHPFFLKKKRIFKKFQSFPSAYSKSPRSILST